MKICIDAEFSAVCFQPPRIYVKSTCCGIFRDLPGHYKNSRLSSIEEFNLFDDNKTLKNASKLFVKTVTVNVLVASASSVMTQFE